MKKKRIVILCTGLTVILVITLIAVWGNTRMKRAVAIQRAIANPEYIKPEALLDKIDDSFMQLSDLDKKKLMKDLQGKKAFVAGIGDDQGYGWAIAKQLAERGCEIIIGTWTPIVKIFVNSWDMGKFDESRKLSDGSLFTYSKLYALDAAFDRPEDVPEELLQNKRYQSQSGYTISEVAKQISEDFGHIDFLVHSLANAPEVKSDLLDTSRAGYLAALSNSSYSFISLLSHFGPFLSEGGAALSLTYLASERAVPGYGGGMSSAKAALESDTRTLAWEAGRKWNIRVNAISAGAYRSRAARAIAFIDKSV